MGTLESEAGLVAPVQYHTEKGSKKLVIQVQDGGEYKEPASGSDWVGLDLIGTRELAGVEFRYPVYTGRSLAYTAAFQIIQAVRAFGRNKSIEVHAFGPYSSLAATYAKLLVRNRFKLDVQDELPSWKVQFDPSFRTQSGEPLNLGLVVQPRANLIGPLEDAYRQAGIIR
jgi:hypothetical protein